MDALRPTNDPAANIAAVQATMARRRGAGNYIGPAMIERIITLRMEGASHRAIARTTGVSRATIAKYAPQLSKSEAMTITHARWKAEGRVVLPPWRRKKGTMGERTCWACDETSVRECRHCGMPLCAVHGCQQAACVATEAALAAMPDEEPFVELEESGAYGTELADEAEDLEDDEPDEDDQDDEDPPDSDAEPPSAREPRQRPASAAVTRTIQERAFEARERERMATGFYLRKRDATSDDAPDSSETPETETSDDEDDDEPDLPEPEEPEESAELDEHVVDDVEVEELAPAARRESRERIRSGRHREVRAETLSVHRIPKKTLALDRMLYPEAAHRQLPMLRSDCIDGPRPCPYVSCSWHLFLEVTDVGSIKFNFPDLLDADGGIRFEEMPATCGLDIVDQGGTTLEEVGIYFNVTRERIRQIELRNKDLLDGPLRPFVEGDVRRERAPRDTRRRRDREADEDTDRDVDSDGEESAA